MTLRLVHPIAALALLLSGSAFAQSSLHILQPTTRATPLPGMTAVGYLQIDNDGKQDDRLLGAQSSAADSVEIHRMSMDGGIMRMRPLQDGLPLPAGSHINLGPAAGSGYHLMLIGVKQQLKVGDKLPVTLNFAKAGAVPVEFVVEPIATGADPTAKP
ncbi:MAG: hypothetical protein JWR16_3151 [Nevskia sp.]|nr:hypothetical protein [Nevskia sp.]